MISLMICRVSLAEFPMRDMAPAICSTAPLPPSTEARVRSANDRAFSAFAAVPRVCSAIAPREACTSSRKLACPEALAAMLCEEEAIWAAAPETWPAASRASSIACCSTSTALLKASGRRARSPWYSPVMRAVRSRRASRSSISIVSSIGLASESKRPFMTVNIFAL